MSTLVTIGDFARMTLLSVKALRHYHDVGLLTPTEIDPSTGYRRYAIDQVPTAQAIRRLRELGMPVEEVRNVIAAPDVSVRNHAIGAHLRRMEGELDRTREVVASLRLLLAETPPQPLPVSYVTRGPHEALAISAEIDYADVFDWLAVAFSDLRAAQESGAGARAGADAALYSSDLLEEEHGEIVAILPVTGAAAAAPDRIERLELGPVEYAVAVHEGSLGDIDRTYAALGTVVAERAIGVHGSIREDYLVGALDTPDETLHRTEIGWPIFQTIAPARDGG